MRIILSIAVSLLLGITHAFSAGLAEMDKKERCEAHVSTAMYGATQQLRGAVRSFQYISLQMFVEMVEHKLGADKLYILQDDYTQEERDFLESASLLGYDRMTQWRKLNPGTQPNIHEWTAAFMDECLSAVQT